MDMERKKREEHELVDPVHLFFYCTYFAREGNGGIDEQTDIAVAH